MLKSKKTTEENPLKNKQPFSLKSKKQKHKRNIRILNIKPPNQLTLTSYLQKNQKEDNSTQPKSKTDIPKQTNYKNYQITVKSKKSLIQYNIIFKIL